MASTPPKHTHIYDAQGKQLYCTQQEKMYKYADAS